VVFLYPAGHKHFSIAFKRVLPDTISVTAYGQGW
jgi:hypothetical protein